MGKRKDVVFYSLIPPSGIEYAVLSFFAPAALPILIGNVLINTVYLFVIALNKLVYYQEFSYINDAIAAERKIKGWIRKKKIELIKTINPEFKNLGI